MQTKMFLQKPDSVVYHIAEQGVMGFVYFIYLALNKDKGSKMEGSPDSTDEAIEEAKRIMDKYK